MKRRHKSPVRTGLLQLEARLPHFPGRPSSSWQTRKRAPACHSLCTCKHSGLRHKAAPSREGPTPELPDLAIKLFQETVFKMGSHTHTCRVLRTQSRPLSAGAGKLGDRQEIQKYQDVCSDVFRADANCLPHHDQPQLPRKQEPRNTPPDADNDVSGPQITQPASLPTWQTFQGLWQNFLKERKKNI